MSIRVEIQGLEELRAAAGEEVAALDSQVNKGLDDAAKIVALRTKRNAPVRSGRLAGSVGTFREGNASGVRVTARRKSRGYPGGFLYPAKIERIRPFLATAVVQETTAVNAVMDEVLDEITRRWGGA